MSYERIRLFGCSNLCTGNFPSFSCPKLVGPTVLEEMWIEFYCEVNTTETDTAARFEFRFLFNGVVADEVPVIPVSGPNPGATLHERYLAGRLDQLVRTAKHLKSHYSTRFLMTQVGIQDMNFKKLFYDS